MPLVEYDASSSDEESDDNVSVGLREEAFSALPAVGAAAVAARPPFGPTAPALPTLAPQGLPVPPPNLQGRGLVTSLHVQSEITSHGPSPSIQLPDASLLLSSAFSSTNQISGIDHLAENASRKRVANGSVPQHPQTKHHRGSSPCSRPIADVKGGLLIPPQLHGRSNVVTEDIGKLFVNIRSERHN
uniref:30S ribosomal protein S12, chloroplastic n=1 Tax=Anthurium amnicola TaxID=1678845 RepID=A0A1D1YJ71_9ARAE